MPATYQGTPFFTGEDPIQNLDTPSGITVEQQRAKLEMLTELNRRHAASRSDQSQLEARILSYRGRTIADPASMSSNI